LGLKIYLLKQVKKCFLNCNIMLFQISWTIPQDQRINCWNVFGKMTPDDDAKDAGEHIKVHGRYHFLSGAGGICICECDDVAHLNSWMLNWSPICNISVVPVVDDAQARASMQDKPWFQKVEASVGASDNSSQ
jgi:hypothetical protein